MSPRKRSTLVGSIVVVEWEDAWTENSSYYTIDSIKNEKPYIGETCGMVIRDDKSGVTVSREKFYDRHRGVQHIPRAMIRKVTKLRGRG